MNGCRKIIRLNQQTLYGEKLLRKNGNLFPRDVYPTAKVRKIWENGSKIINYFNTMFQINGSKPVFVEQKAYPDPLKSL